MTVPSEKDELRVVEWVNKQRRLLKLPPVDRLDGRAVTDLCPGGRWSHDEVRRHIYPGLVISPIPPVVQRQINRDALASPRPRSTAA